MADPTQKWEDSVPGPYYVDKECILCSLCVDIAPRSFVESEDGDHDTVFKQPETDEEREACEEALQQCPVDAIGNDGAG